MKRLFGMTTASDLFIVDEAHSFMNPKSNGHETLSTLFAGTPEGGRPRCILLTATPMSKGLQDLNALIALIRGERLASLSEVAENASLVNVTRPFIERHFGEKTGPDATPKLRFGNELRSFARVAYRKVVYPFRGGNLLRAIQALPLRFFETREVQEQLQQDLPGIESTPRMRDLGPLMRVLLMRLAESSPRALQAALNRISLADAVDAEDLQTGIAALQAALDAQTEDAKLLHLGRRKPKGDLDLLVATDAIAEGENLQDADVLINYDLHWTPLKLIQRVGRLDRPTKVARQVDVHNYYPDGSVFEDLLSMWTRLENRSQLYEQLARIRVLEREDDEGLQGDDFGLIRAIYEASSWEKLLLLYLPSSNHLVHLASSTEKERDAASTLPPNAFSIRRGMKAGTFALLRYADTLACVTDASPHAAGILESPEAAAHEALLPVVSCERDEEGLAETSNALAQVDKLVRDWARQRNIDLDTVEIICAEVLVGPASE